MAVPDHIEIRDLPRGEGIDFGPGDIFGVGGDLGEISEPIPDGRQIYQNPRFFSDRGRENRAGIDPETGLEVELLTKKQFLKALKRQLKEF